MRDPRPTIALLNPAPPYKERRPISSQARLYDRRLFEQVQASGNVPLFKTADGERYLVHKSGAFVNADKDRRSVKERKRAKRDARQAVASSASVSSTTNASNAQ